MLRRILDIAPTLAFGSIIAAPWRGGSSSAFGSRCRTMKRAVADTNRRMKSSVFYDAPLRDVPGYDYDFEGVVDLSTTGLRVHRRAGGGGKGSDSRVYGQLRIVSTPTQPRVVVPAMGFATRARPVRVDPRQGAGRVLPV